MEKDMDYCQLKEQSEITGEFESDEILQLTAQLQEIDDNGTAQDCILLLTNKSVYNVADKKVKRKIKISDIIAMSKNDVETDLEFIIHDSSDSDYKFKVESLELRNEIFAVYEQNHKSVTKESLPVYDIAQSYLKHYHTIKSYFEKGIVRILQEAKRIKSKDTVKEGNEGFEGNSNEEETKSTAPGETNDASYTTKKDDEVCLEDFIFKKVLGKNGCGKVSLVEKKSDHKLYAMRTYTKVDICENDLDENIQLEKEILLKEEHPFLRKMVQFFETDQEVCFVMDFIRSGDLFTYLENEKRFTEERAKFYAAQIVSVIGYLHKKKIIFRNVKPENMLMGDDGYLYLDDLSTVKDMSNRNLTYSFCGSPEYLAPEMIRGNGHNHAVDWWSIGISIYEMIVGFPPFYHSNQQTMYELIQKYSLKFPDPIEHKIPMSEEVKDFLTKLLKKDPKDRLGTEGDVDEVMSHEWFTGFDFDKLLNRELDAPFIPKLSEDASDVSQSDDESKKQDPVDTKVEGSASKEIEKSKDLFEGFDS